LGAGEWQPASEEAESKNHGGGNIKFMMGGSPEGETRASRRRTTAQEWFGENSARNIQGCTESKIKKKENWVFYDLVRGERIVLKGDFPSERGEVGGSTKQTLKSASAKKPN